MNTDEECYFSYAMTHALHTKEQCLDTDQSTFSRPSIQTSTSVVPLGKFAFAVRLVAPWNTDDASVEICTFRLDDAWDALHFSYLYSDDTFFSSDYLNYNYVCTWLFGAHVHIF